MTEIHTVNQDDIRNKLSKISEAIENMPYSGEYLALAVILIDKNGKSLEFTITDNDRPYLLDLILDTMDKQIKENRKEIIPNTTVEEVTK